MIIALPILLILIYLKKHRKISSGQCLKCCIVQQKDGIANTGTDPGPIWGMHVRHGDVKSLADDYNQRKVFEFSEYFSALQTYAKQTKNKPQAVFVASDSEDTQDVVESMCKLPEQAKWGSDYLVCVYTADAKDRFRAEHGAHIVAADGGCKPIMVRKTNLSSHGPPTDAPSKYIL